MQKTSFRLVTFYAKSTIHKKAKFRPSICGMWVPMIHKLQKQENKGKKPLIVLDSGFVSNHNLTQLKKEGFDYIVVGKRNNNLGN